MLRISVAIAVALCVVFALQPVQAQEKVQLEYKWKVGHYTRTTEIDQSVSQGMGGQQMEVKSEIQTVSAEEVKAVDEAGTATIEKTVRRVVADMDNPLMGGAIHYDSKEDDAPANPALAQLAQMVGQCVRVVTDKRGQVSSAKVVAGGGNAEQLEQQQASTKFCLPDRPVAVGDTWSTTQTQPLPQVGELTMTFTFTLEGLEGKVATIGIRGEISLQVSADAPMEIRLGDQSLSGTWRFDREAGRDVGATFDVAMTFLIQSPMGEVTQKTSQHIDETFTEGAPKEED